MVQRPFFVDIVFELMTGVAPLPELSRRDAMITVVARWDSSRIVTPQERDCARIALSCIGLDWHLADHMPYSFDDVAAKLREIAPVPMDTAGALSYMSRQYHPPTPVRGGR